MLKKLLISIFLMLATPVLAQNVQMSPPVTRGHIPYWVTSGVIGDGGSSADSPISSIGITNSGGNGLCINSARQSSAGYNALCFGANTTGPATISLQNFGTAPAEPLQFVIDGTTYPFPGALAGIIINSTSVTGGVNGDCLTVNSLTVGQTPCSIITAPTTGSGSVVFNTSPTLAGTIGGNLTWSGNQTYSANDTFSGQAIFTGTTIPSQSVGNTIVGGTIAPPTLSQTAQAYLFNTAANGAMVQGFGTLFDVVLANKAGTPVLEVPTGQTNVTIPSGFTLSGLSSGSCTNGLGLNASNQAITVSCPGAASSIQVGVTTISSGSSGNIEYNNAGTLGELTPNGGVKTSSSNLQLDGAYSGWALQNCTITATVATNNLTVALKDNGGNNPSATSPCNINFRNSTLATGSTSLVQVTSALSFTANAGSTFGVTNTSATCSAASSCPFRLWIVAMNNGGTVVLGVVDLTNASGVLPLNEGILASATACNACSGATTLGTIYATATQTSIPLRILGYLEWGSGLATAGNYASAPTIIQTMGPGIRKPGEVVQGPLVATSSSTASSTSTVKVQANPSQAIIPTSSANLIRIHVVGSAQATSASVACQSAISRGTSFAALTAGAVAVTNSNATGINSVGSSSPIDGLDAPGTTSSITYVPFLWSSISATCNWNSTNNSGAPTSFIEVSEIMG